MSASMQLIITSKTGEATKFSQNVYGKSGSNKLEELLTALQRVQCDVNAHLTSLVESEKILGTNSNRGLRKDSKEDTEDEDDSEEDDDNKKRKNKEEKSAEVKKTKQE